MLYINTVIIFATFFLSSPPSSVSPGIRRKKKFPITRKMELLAGVRGKGANPVGGLCGKGNGPVENKIHLRITIYHLPFNIKY